MRSLSIRRCLLLLITSLLALNASAQVTYESPPEGRLPYAPYVVINNDLYRIIRFEGEWPVIERDGEIKPYRQQPKYLFLPAPAFSPVRVIEERQIAKELVTTFTSAISTYAESGVMRGLTLDTSGTDFFYMGMLTINPQKGEFLASGRQLEPIEANTPTQYYFKTGTPDNYRADRFYFSIYFYDDGLPMRQGEMAESRELIERSSRRFFDSIRKPYLEANAGKTLKVKPIHTPMPPTPAVENPPADRRLIFRVKFDIWGDVVRVIPQTEGAPEAWERAGVQALFAWKALPALKDGQTVETEVLIPLMF